MVIKRENGHNLLRLFLSTFVFSSHSFSSPPFNTDGKYTSESNANNLCNNFEKRRNRRTEKVKGLHMILFSLYG